MRATAYHRCLAVHLHFAEPERIIFAKPSRWKRWLPVWLVPLLGLIVLQADFVRFINWCMS